MWWRWAGLIGSPAVMAAVVTVLSRGPESVPIIVDTTAPQPCTTPITWRPTVPSGPTATRLNAGWRWWDAGAMLATMCGPGVLTVTGTGQVYQGAGPLIVVTLNNDVIARWSFNGAQAFRVPVGHAGEVALLLNNPLFTRQGSRRLTFQTLTFEPL